MGDIFTGIDALRMVLHTETDAASPDNETTYAAIRKAIECLFLILLGTGVDGTVTGIAETVLTDTGNFVDSAHAGHTLVMTDGAARGNMYTIDSNTVNALTCTGDTLVSDGVAIGDDYVILYDVKTSTGHTHNAINAPSVVLANDSIGEQHYSDYSVNSGHLKTGGGNASASIAQNVTAAIAMQDFCFFPNIGAAAQDYFSLWAYTSTNVDYVSRFSVKNIDASSRTYTIYWRYVQASDEPFFYVIRDSVTGKVIATWICDDPPPGYFGMSERPDDFQPPIVLTPAPANFEDLTVFKYPKDGFNELMNKSKKDKKPMHEMIDAGYDYDDKKKLFVAKNLVHI